MARALLITVRFHGRRYHGTGDWPPAPARLFQALLAGIARGKDIPPDFQDALKWLEGLEAPTIATPRSWAGQSMTIHPPKNNDYKISHGQLQRMAQTKGGEKDTKVFRPRMFDVELPFLYAWEFEHEKDAEVNAHLICAAAERLYQLGRGIDMAWGWGEVINSKGLHERLAQYPGRVYRPGKGSEGNMLKCPVPGSLASLETRFAAGTKRLIRILTGSKTQVHFSQAPKPRFRLVAYDSPPKRLLFDLRHPDNQTRFAPWPLASTYELVRCLRDAAFDRLRDTLPEREAEAEDVLVGRNPPPNSHAIRVRIVPLPSVGHVHADRAVRRVLIEIPPDCPIQADDINWAFSGCEPVDQHTGEVLPYILVPASDGRMLGHYGISNGGRAHLWRTVTAAALPEHTARRRIDPKRRREEAKDGPERSGEENRAATAVLQALRHADVSAPVSTVRVQREPFYGKEIRAELFASGTRFDKRRLWHVEIGFGEPISGPLLIGDGRYMGLGLMVPVRRTQGVLAFSIVDGLDRRASPTAVAQALRRAVMARVQAYRGKRAQLPAFFTGHTEEGKPLRDPIAHSHLAFVADLERHRLLIVAPHRLCHREVLGDERRYLRFLDEALVDFTELRAGEGGLLKLTPSVVHEAQDPLFAVGRRWESVAAYRPTRHPKRMSPEDGLVADVLLELRRRELPAPEIEVLDVRKGPRGGFSGRLRLRFKAAQAGPILIGRNCHFGGGLFCSVSEP